MKQQQDTETQLIVSTEETLSKTAEDCNPLDSISDLVVHQDTQMRILWANRVAGDSVDLAPRDLVGQHCFEIWHGRSEPCANCPVARALKTGRAQQGEVTSPDGREWFIKGYPVRDLEGNVISIIEITTDITEQKLAEIELRESEAKYRALVEQSIQGILVLQDMQLVFANRPLSEICGYTIEELQSLTSEELKALVHPEDREMVWGRYASRIAGEDALSHYELRILRKDGSVGCIDVHSNLIMYKGRPALQAVVLDITDRKCAGEALRESEEKYSNLFHHSNDAIFIHDQEGRIVDANQKALDFFGYPKSEILSLKIRDLHPAEALETSKNAFETIARDGFVNFEIGFKKHNGEVFPAEVSSSLFEIRGKKVIQGIVRDITERKRADQELRESEERYRALVENINEVIFTLNTQGCFTYISPVIEQILGYQPEEIVNQPFNCFVHPDDAPGLLVALDQSLGGNVRPYEFRLTAKKGAVHYVLISCRPLLDGDHLLGLTGVMADVTQSKMAEAELKETEEMYRTLVRTTTDAVTVSDLDGTITQVSDRTVKLHGSDSAEELMGRSTFEFIVPEEQEKALANLKQTLREGSVRSVEYTLLRKNGTRFRGEMDAAVIKGADGKPKAFIAATRDITERKRVEEAHALEKERLDATLSSICDGIVATDREGKMVIFNPAAEYLTGWKEEEALGKNPVRVLNIVKESSHEPYGNPVPDILEAGEMAGLVTKRGILIAKDGTERTIMFSLAPIRTKTSDIDGVVIVFYDIAEKMNQLR